MGIVEIIIIIASAAIVIGTAAAAIVRKKKGKPSCPYGGSCGSCSGCGYKNPNTVEHNTKN